VSTVLPASVTTPDFGKNVYGTWITVRAGGPLDLASFPQEAQLSPRAALSSGQSPYMNPAFINQLGDGPLWVQVPQPFADFGGQNPQELDVTNGVIDVFWAQTVGWTPKPVLYSPVHLVFQVLEGTDCVNGSLFQGPYELDSPNDWTVSNGYAWDRIFTGKHDQQLAVNIISRSWAPEVPQLSACIPIHTAPEVPPPPPVCNNGIVEVGEECDGDPGCQPDCTWPVVGCNQPFNASGNFLAQGKDFVVKLGAPHAHGWFFYDTLTIPDHVRVTSDNVVLLDNGCESTNFDPSCVNGICAVPIVGGSQLFGEVHIHVSNAECASPSAPALELGTKWMFEVDCPNTNGSSTPAPSAE